MADYTMTKGMSDWQVPYNNFVKDNVIVDNGWSNSGVTFQNGFSQADGANVKYRKVSYGKVHAIHIIGWIKTPALKAFQLGTVACTLPVSLFSDKTAGVPNLQIGHTTNIGETIATVDVDPSNGQLKINNNSSQATKADGLELNFTIYY